MIMTKDHGPRIKGEDTCEALREQGYRTRAGALALDSGARSETTTSEPPTAPLDR